MKTPLIRNEKDNSCLDEFLQNLEELPDVAESRLDIASTSHFMASFPTTPTLSKPHSDHISHQPSILDHRYTPTKKKNGRDQLLQDPRLQQAIHK